MLSAETKYDRTLRFRVGAFAGELRSNDERFLADFGRVFYHRGEPEGPPDLCYRVAVDRTLGPSKRHSVIDADSRELVLVTARYPSIFPTLEQRIDQKVVAAHERHCPLVGAFVAWGAKGLLIVGDFDSGRSLLVKALTARGCVYFGDGLAILLMPRREALHVPKGLALPRASNALTDFRRRGLLFRQRDSASVRYVLPERLGELAAAPGPGIDALLFTARRPGGRAQVEPLGRAEALARLMAHTFASARYGARRFAYLADLVRAVPAYSVRIKGLKQTTDRIFEELAPGSPG